MALRTSSSYGSDEPNVAAAVDAEMIKTAGRVIGIEFTPSEAELMTRAVNINYANFETLRSIEFGNAPIPAYHFNPRLASHRPPPQLPLRERPLYKLGRPQRLEELAFYPVYLLAELVRTRTV